MAGESVDSLCQKARQAVAQGNHSQARQLYLQALGVKSDSPDVHYGLATVCFLLNDLASAAHHFKEVTRLDPLRAGAHVNLGAVYNRLDQFDDAIQSLRRGIQLDTQRAEGYYNLGLVHRRKGQLDLSIQAYREATRVNPRMADAHLNLANVYYEKEQFNQAVAYYRHALELRPNWEKALHGLEQAEAAMAAAGPLVRAAPPIDQEKVVVRSAEAVSPDLNKTIDPNAQGPVLTNLHKATIESETFGRQFLQVLEGEIEPAIKELSAALLYPTTTSSELDKCVGKFDNAIKSMRSAHRNLQSSIERVRSLGEKLVSG